MSVAEEATSTRQTTHLVIISGRSGSGKSTALNVLEDLGFYSVDNLPASLTEPLLEKSKAHALPERIAISIDARNTPQDLEAFPEVLARIKDITLTIVFLDARTATLIQRFSETRRKHPLSTAAVDLKEALERESSLLDGLASMASLKIDTTNLSLHQLREEVRARVAETDHRCSLLFESFAFKRGVPVDADFVFDVRSLPNPHWEAGLRALTGLDQGVVDFLEQHDDILDMRADLIRFIKKWLPSLKASNRSYISIAIGCTGGQHRSVYFVNALSRFFLAEGEQVITRHREIEGV